MRCPKCGKKLDDSVNMCPICKTKLGESLNDDFTIPMDHIDPKTDEDEKMVSRMRMTEKPIKPKFDPRKDFMQNLYGPPPVPLYGPPPVRDDVPPVENDDPPKKRRFFRRKKNENK